MARTRPPRTRSVVPAVVAALAATLVLPVAAGAPASGAPAAGAAAAPVVLSLAGGTAVEGDEQNSPATFLAHLDRPSTAPVTFRFAVRGVTATPSLDFVRHTRDVTIPAGQVFVELAVDTVGDTLVEGDETFTGTLSSVVGAAVGTASATATILDDDPGPADGLGVYDRDVVEGDVGSAGVSFVVRLSRPQTHAVTLAWHTEDGTATAGQDYRSAGGTLTIPAGGRKARVRVTVYGDAVREGTERFTVRLTSVVGATPTKPVGTATVLDDD